MEWDTKRAPRVSLEDDLSRERGMVEQEEAQVDNLQAEVDRLRRERDALRLGLEVVTTERDSLCT